MTALAIALEQSNPSLFKQSIRIVKIQKEISNLYRNPNLANLIKIEKLEKKLKDV